MMSIYFLHIVDKNNPRHSLDDSFLWTPGVSYRPRLSDTSTLLRFLRTNSSQRDYLNQAAKDFLSPYRPENQVGDDFMDCSNGRSIDDPQKLCAFKTEYLGACTENIDFGYEDGTPCFFFKINKLNAWTPENYEPDEVPEEIKHVWQKNVITLTCDGADEVSKEYVGTPTYYPTQGWSFDYFPFNGQLGYRPPLVAVKFLNMHFGVPIFMECRAWAKNIFQDEERNLGYVKFEIINDN